MLASLTDIQTWLARDKLRVDDAMAKGPLVEAERLIRGQLTGMFTALVMSSWDEPDNTPEQIRGIAGRLVAAFIYRNTFSEETTDVSAYAVTLYNEALQMIADIKTGNLEVLDTNGDSIVGDTGGVLSFWPNTSVASKFTMDQEFA